MRAFVEIEVEISDEPNADGTYEFRNVRLGRGPAIPVPLTAPAPRRLRTALAQLAAATIAENAARPPSPINRNG